MAVAIGDDGARRRGTGIAGLFASAVASQGLTSGANFAVGLILIRHEAPAQYGYYVLVASALLLLCGIQFAYLGPSLIIRLAALDLAGRRALVGGMLREQRRASGLAAVAAATVVAALRFAGVVEEATAMLLAAALLAASAAMQRECFRMVLLAYRRPLDVLKSDLLYVVLLVGGAAAATMTPMPAVTAVATLAGATAAGAALLSRRLRAHEGWDDAGAPGVLREIAPLGKWAVFGAAVHWSFSQGYAYIVGGMLDVEAVAALAATRLLLMPVNLLSQGVAQVMLPTTSRWLLEHTPARVLARLARLCGSIAGAAACYCAVAWLLRDWIFDDLLRRRPAQGDTLLLLWGAIFVAMAVRDQAAHLLVARGKLRALSSATFASAVVSLAAIVVATLRWGPPGALAGVLLGELLNLAAIGAMSLRECRAPVGQDPDDK